MINDVLFVVYTERKWNICLISSRLANKTEGVFIMIRTVILDRNQKPTQEQIRQIKEDAKKEIVYDEDSPELTPAMEKVFRLAAKNWYSQWTLLSVVFRDIYPSYRFWNICSVSKRCHDLAFVLSYIIS